ncbi:UNVERIFIED_CONTAM: hypothetical protein FKN15_048971 [Acipenser sinensis]
MLKHKVLTAKLSSTVEIIFDIFLPSLMHARMHARTHAEYMEALVQWLKKRACNQEVPGSNPTSATDSLCDPEQVT